MDREPGSARPLGEQFRFDTGSVELNLLATLGFRDSPEPVERMATVSRARQWLAAGDLPGVVTNASQVVELHQLREAAYLVLRAVADDRLPSRGSVHQLSRWTRRPMPGPDVHLDGPTLAWRPPPTSFDQLLTGLARDLASLPIDRREELRVCDADGCGLIYLDTSRGRRRRWCSMERCGNAAKAARHRARLRAAGPA